MKYKLIPSTIVISNTEVKPPQTSDKFSKTYVKAKIDAEQLAIRTFEEILNKELADGFEFVKEINVKYFWDKQTMESLPHILLKNNKQ